MHPYRRSSAPPERQPPEEDDASGDDRLVLWVALLVSLMGLVPRISQSRAWGAEPTIALLVALGSGFQLGRYGLVALWRRMR